MTIPRPLRISLRGMETPLRVAYFGVVGFAVAVMLVAAWAGLVVAVPLILLFVVAFAYTAPFILGRRWRPPPPRPTRRPVVVRRRG